MKNYSSSNLPKTIPLFPLPGVMLLPRSQLPLNIFEPRYLAMLDDALKSEHRLIGMIQPLKSESDDLEPALHRIGCAGRIVSFTETDDNRYLIKLGGISRFRMLSELDGKTPYIQSVVEWDGFERDLGGEETDQGFQRETFISLLKSYFETCGLAADMDDLKGAEEELLINSLAMLCPFDAAEKQALLEAKTLRDRRQTISALMEFMIASNGAASHKSLQ